MSVGGIGPAVLARKARAFLLRDLRVEASYKFAFVFEALTSIFPVVTLYFVGRLIGGRGAGALKPYGGEYFPFAMIGAAFTQYMMVALRTFANTIRRSQMAGCLEAMLSTRTRPQTVVLLSSVYSFTVKTVHVALVFAVGGLAFGVDYRAADWAAAVVTLAVTVAVFSALGIFSAAVIVTLKKGDPIEWVFGSLLGLLGGALFPVEVLPGWLRAVSAVLPLTHALEAMRLAVLRGWSIPMLWRPLGLLGAMAAVLVPLSVWTFARAVERGRRDGSLMHY